MLFASCGYNDTTVRTPGGGASPDPGGAANGEPDEILYAQVNDQVFIPHCLRCHSQSGGNRGGVNLETYSAVLDQIQIVVDAVNSGFMPRSGNMPETAVTMLNDWVAAGAPE